jgi:hypothetical protein
VLERHVAESFKTGKRVIVLAESKTDQLTRDLFGRTGYGPHPDQVQIRSAADVYVGGHPFDSNAMLGGLAADKQQALTDGFTGIHILADMTWAADDPRALDALAAHERASDDLYSDGHASALCQYDRTRFRAGTIAACAAAHPALESAFDETDKIADDRAAFEIGRYGTVRARGEIDILNAELLGRALAVAAERSSDVCLDASELMFIDVRGMHELFDAARRIGGVALLAPRSPLRGMLDAFDAHTQLPGLHAG